MLCILLEPLEHVNFENMPHPCLLLHQATPFPLHYPSAKGRRKVLAVKGLLGYKHVALGAPGVDSVTLFHYHNCIPQVAVCKVNLEVCPTQRPTQSPFYRAPELRQVVSGRRSGKNITPKIQTQILLNKTERL